MRRFVLFCTIIFTLIVCSPVLAAEKESTYDRVMRTNVLRCGYVVIPPQFAVDPNTGKFSGIAYDIVMEAARRLNLKVEWAEQVTFATAADGIKSGRYDAFCLTTYRWSTLARAFDYTDPIFYSTTDAYVRAKDTRFDHGLSPIDSDKVTVSAIDGEGGETIRNEDFPQAKLYSMPQDTGISLLLEAVADGKADVTFANPLMVMPYLLAKPGTIKRIENVQPIRAYAHALAFGKGDYEMVSTFNVVLDEMLNSGVTDRILDRYETIPHSLTRVKSPVRNYPTSTASGATAP